MAARHVAAFFEKFEHDRYECQELLQYTVANLHMPIEDFKVPIDPPLGVISNISPISEFRVMLLLPQEEGIEAIDMREVHQIVKELTNGIFVFNQTPTISLEPNFDLSSSCQMPPAYHDTRIGQLLINVDYMLKAVWHGVYFAREQRIKFSERWRNCLDVNSSGKSETRKDVFNEFVNAGEFEDIESLFILIIFSDVVLDLVNDFTLLLYFISCRMTMVLHSLYL